MQENTKIYKIFHEYFFKGKSAGKSVLCRSFSSLEKARKYAEKILEFHTVYLTIHEYSSLVSIISGDSDNGKIVDIMHNCIAMKVLCASDVQDKAESTLKNVLDKFGYPIIMMDCIDTDCEHGKQYAIIVGCRNTEDNFKKT